MGDWQTVIGLEVHVQLATRSKLFSAAANGFGGDPNTRICATDLALPGTLPTLNKEAVMMGARFGMAVGARIKERSVFERKNYFYPDLPRGYQISQFRDPLVEGGEISIGAFDGVAKTVRLTRAHLEEDAGKLVHTLFAKRSAVDLNRAGVPLLEVVTEPDMRSPEEAVAFMRRMHALVVSLGICDGDMSQGSLRCDVNVSLRLGEDAPLGVRTEMKNINSFRFVDKAIRGEIERQREILDAGGEVAQQTRLYDSDNDVSRVMRDKEEEMDYRYFPDPDLLPVVLSDADLRHLEETMPELPADAAARLARDCDLDEAQAENVASDRARLEYFEAALAAGGDAKQLFNWMNGELAARLNETETSIADSPVAPASLASLTNALVSGEISSKIAKRIFSDLWAGESDVAAIIERHGLTQITDDEAIDALIEQVLTEHADVVAQYAQANAGKRKKTLSFLVGQTLKASGGKADPALVNKALSRRLNED